MGALEPGTGCPLALPGTPARVQDARSEVDPMRVRSPALRRRRRHRRRGRRLRLRRPAVVALLGRRSGRRGARLRRRRPGPRRDRRRDPWGGDRRSARRRLALARPDGLQPRRLVQLRPHRHEGRQRQRDPARPAAPGRRATSCPNSPDTAFVVRSLEPGQSLVLYADEKTVEEQVAAARARKEAGEATEATPANLKAAGRMMPAMPGFAASWAFVLRPLDDGRKSRLTERFRIRMAAPEGPAGDGLRRRLRLRLLRHGPQADAGDPRSGRGGAHRRRDLGRVPRESGREDAGGRPGRLTHRASGCHGVPAMTVSRRTLAALFLLLALATGLVPTLEPGVRAEVQPGAGVPRMAPAAEPTPSPPQSRRPSPPQRRPRSRPRPRPPSPLRPRRPSRPPPDADADPDADPHARAARCRR